MIRLALLLTLIGMPCFADRVEWGEPVPTTVSSEWDGECIKITAMNRTTMYVDNVSVYTLRMDGVDILIAYDQVPGARPDTMTTEAPTGWTVDLPEITLQENQVREVMVCPILLG